MMRRLVSFAPIAGIVSLVVGCVPDRLDTAVEEDVLTIHWVTTEIGPEVRMCEVLGSNEEIAVEPEPLFTLAAFDSAAVEILPNGHASVNVFLSGKTRNRLAEVTAENVGRRLAILVDGVAHSMPLVRDRVDVEALSVGFYADAGFAAEVAARLNRTMRDRR